MCYIDPEELKCKFKINHITQNNCKSFFQRIILNSSLQVMALYDVNLT